MPRAPPIVIPITGAQRPTVSETRAPWISRASSSRPRPSLPNQCRADGGARRSSMSMSVGPNGNRPAKAAAATTRLIQAIAAQNSGPSRRVRLIARTATSSMPSSSVAMTDPGIEDGVEHIDNKVQEHEAGGDEQHDTLQNDQIPGVHRADQKPADPRKCENRLHDQGAADQAADIDAGDRHEGQR